MLSVGRLKDDGSCRDWIYEDMNLTEFSEKTLAVEDSKAG